MTTLAPERAFALCGRLARNHYENFPVASILLPAALRRPVAAIYAFARTADDFADEHDWDDSTRLALLAAYRAHLDTLARGEVPPLPVFVALAEAVNTHALPLPPLYALLDAFEQDVRKKRYANFDEVLDYCRRSANPVGRLLLRLFRRDTDENRRRSDAICTSLQLINFLQDIHPDFRRGRIYLPQDEMARFGVSERHIREGVADDAWRSLIEFQITRIAALLRSGASLGSALPGRLGLDIRMIVTGAGGVLEKLRRSNRHRFIGGERLGAWDWVRLAPGALLRKGS